MVASRLFVHASLVACAASWGLVFVGIHELLPAMTAVQLVTVRFVIICLAFLVGLAVMPSLRVFPRDRSDWLRFALCGLLAVPGAQLSLVESQHYLSPQLASLLVTVSPVLTAALAAVLLSEVLTRRRVVGLVLALAGAVFIVLFGAGHAAGIGHVTLTPVAALGLLTPLSWSLYTVLSRPLAARYPPFATVGMCLAMGTVALLPFTADAFGALGGLSAPDWGWLIFLALGGSLLPYLIWFYALRTLSANRVAVYMYAIPLFAMVFAWLILHLAPGEVAWIGAGFVLVGVFLAQSQDLRRGRPVEAAATGLVGGAPLMEIEET